MRYGSRSDAQALLPAFLDDPEAREELIPVFARHGDLAMAEYLLDASVEAGRLRDGVPTEVLHAVGCLGYEPAERLLWNYVEGEYWGSTDACLGLLHLPCRGLQAEIAEALERHLGDNLFPEFLPVLASKTGDPSWLGRLVEWGEGGASTDCNGGLILGIALYGDAARDEFTRLLWNPWWEAHSTATGSNRWAYAGARVLGLGMSELYADLVARVKSEAQPENKRHCVAMFTALLGLWTGGWRLGVRMAPDPSETSDELIDLLFEWSTTHNDYALLGLAHSVLDHDDHIITDLHHLEATLRLQAQHEMEIREFTDRS
ncbi:hypothetical protein [Embleya sp. NPDC001921]